MDRRTFFTVPLAALAAPGALLAAAGPSHAVGPSAPVPEAFKAPRALKGVCLGGKDALTFRQIRNLNADWYYNWSHSQTATGTPYVPMIKDAKRLLERDAVGYVNRELSATKTKHLLGFNEPDHHLQANMSVDEAVRLWPLLQTTGLRLGSPAVVSPNSPWLDKFMIEAKRNNLRVDFIATHCYAWPNSESFLRKISELHDKHGLPIWVTEYAVADWNATSTRKNIYSRKQVETFMRETVAGMRSMPYVERFAWKTRAITDPVMGTSALFHTNGKLTTTGKLYASL